MASILHDDLPITKETARRENWSLSWYYKDMNAQIQILNQKTLQTLKAILEASAILFPYEHSSPDLSMIFQDDCSFSYSAITRFFPFSISYNTSQPQQLVSLFLSDSPSTFPPLQIHSSLVCLQKRAGLPGLTIKQSGRTTYKTSYQV